METKNQPGDTNRNTDLIYVIIFKSGTSKEMLNFLILLQNILKGYNLNTGTDSYTMYKNIPARETFRFFDHKAQEKGN